MGKFDAFNRLDLEYGTVQNHPLEVTILTPKTLQSQNLTKCPLLVYWHGGGFIAGDRMYEPWWSTWLIELALSQDAMIVTPDYRLMPEASGADVLDDVETFWTWLHHDLPQLAENWRGRPDLDQILCCGQSCGGLLAVHSPLIYPEARIKAVISISAPLFGKVPYFTVPKPKPIMGMTLLPPRQAEARIRAYIRAMPPGAVRTQGDVRAMWDLITCVVQQGWLPKLITRRLDDRLDLLREIEQKKQLPAFWGIHGQQDSVIPSACSELFVEKVKVVAPDVPLRVSLEQGEHGFDADVHLSEPWVRSGCDWLSQHWPAPAPS